MPHSQVEPLLRLCIKLHMKNKFKKPRLSSFSILVFVLFLVVLIIGLFIKISQSYNDPEVMQYTLNGRKLKLLIADSQEEWTKGLMYYRRLDTVDGMIFLFPYKNYRNFWNKNTYLDLNVYWIAGDEVAGMDELPSIEKSKKIIYISSPKPVDKVIELVK